MVCLMTLASHPPLLFKIQEHQRVEVRGPPSISGA